MNMAPKFVFASFLIITMLVCAFNALPVPDHAKIRIHVPIKHHTHLHTKTVVKTVHVGIPVKNVKTHDDEHGWEYAMEEVTPRSNEHWKRAYLGPLPDEFLRVTTAQDIQEVSDRQAALALQSYHNTYTPHMAPNFVGRLSITIAQAKLVKNYGITRMDPYVRLRVGHFVYETQTAPNGGRNPRWNRVIHCQLPAGVETIALEIYDECNFSMDELIAWAEIRIPQSVLRGETHEDWYPLSGKQGEGLEGSIDMVMSFNNMVVQPRMIQTNAPVVLVPNVASGTPMPVFVAPNQPQVARLPPPVLSDDDLTRIHEMFPQVDKEVIKSVAIANNQDRDAVINALLQMTRVSRNGAQSLNKTTKMIRISALNEEESDEDSNGFDTELIVTKEAEETIAISEYVRALQMKNENKQQDALELLLELLDTQVINDVTTTQADNKLFAVKYNCYRNIGLIYEEQGKQHLAIEFLMKAMDLDETDVYTMSRLAHMALKTGHLEISKMYFEKCLKRNPNHWPSMEGLLRVFCNACNVVEAYGWASQCHRKDSRNKLYVDVLRAIRERFKSTLSYLDTVFLVPPTFDFTEEEKRRPLALALETFDELFKPYPQADDSSDLTVMPETLKNVMKIDDLSFETIGNVLVKLNQLMEELDLKCVFMVDTDELFCEHRKEKPEQMEEDVQMSPDATECAADVSTAKDENRMEMEEEEICGEEVNDVGAAGVKCNEDANGNGTSAADSADSGVDANEQAKNKARRRGSELKILEQWGWHKNRRSTRKKSVQEVNDPVDATADSFFKQAVKQHLSEDSRFKESPFLSDEQGKEPENDPAGEVQPTESSMPITQLDFCRECNLRNFVAEMKASDIDVYALMYGFLAHISKSWGVAMKPELRSLYLEVHSHFVQYTEYNSWNQLSEDQLEVIYQITLFHLELKLDAGLTRTNEQTASVFDQFDEEVFHRCRFYVDSLPNLQTVTVYRIRLLWIAYILDCSMQKYDEALDNLYLILELVEAPGEPRIELSFPNQCANTSISGGSVRELIGETERKLRIERVKRHYDNGDHEPVVAILKDTLQYYTTIGNPDESILSLTIQTQMLLESLWSMAEMEECFIWSEKSFTYSVQQFMTAPVQHDSRKSRMWANNINFALLYMESNIKQEGVAIIDVLGKNLSRLIQSLHRMLTHQLDPSGEKNYTAQLCLIECWRAWIVLYYILERQDDMDSLVKLNRTPAIADQCGALELEPDRLCNSIMMCFVAHELLGKKNWCSKGDSGLLFHTLDVVVPKIRSPMLEPCREILNEYLEQVTYCLYGYPQKRPRLRHIQDHCAVQVSLTWERAIQLFDLYRPDSLPEFNSYKLESISTDMEALLQRIILLIPIEINVMKLSRPILEFIDGKGNTLPEAANILQSEVKPIFYLLADFYFKSRDFTRAISYYVKDLALEPSRFDSWAGISLSKASKVETKLNSTETIPLQEFLDETDNGMKCFDQCLQLNEEDSQLWIEYGSFAYNIHSFCSRSLKLLSDTLSMESFALVETHKERCLDIAFTCFNKVSLMKLCYSNAAGDIIEDQQLQSNQENGHNHEDEVWLHHYMLGKIAEKKKEHPAVYLTHYLKSAKYLYECNATYPIKINHSSPSQLAIEALEIFYRINAAIIKYVEQHSPINKKTSRLFLRTLKELSTSPFAVNRAKINENMLKRKISPNGNNGNAGGGGTTGDIEVSVGSPKVSKTSEQIPTESALVTTSDAATLDENKPRDVAESTAAVLRNSPQPTEPKSVASEMPPMVDETNVPSPVSASSQMPSRMLEHLRVEEIKQLGDPQNPSVRRGSQESAITSTTTTTTTTTSTSSSSSDSSDSDTDTSSDSDSDSTSTDDELINQQPISPAQRDTIFKLCIKNLEECITRFPEHYKSMYRLIHHFMHAPGTTKSFESARQLLLGTYRTTLGNQIPGLFTERKTTNFFNGLWRIPASDIDRPGNFASHISKCVIVLMETLKEFSEYDVLLELALQLQRTPEPDKKYLNDYERKELVQQAILFCVQVYRSMLKKYTDGRNDTELLSLMVDMYKAYRKIIKHMQAKEPMFATALVDAYRVFVSDKVPKLPENVSLLDLAVKLCTYEINYRKTQEKHQQATGSAVTGTGGPGTGNGGNGSKPMLTSGELPATMIVPMQPISANFIPGLTKQNRRLGVTKSTIASTPTTTSEQSILQQHQQQHGYPVPNPYAQTTMNNMMSDLSSRVTITPIMLESATSATNVPNSSKVTTSTTASTTATKSLAFPTTATNELLLPMATGSGMPLPSATPPAQLSTPSVTAAMSSSSLYQQYLKLFSQIPNIASISNNPMMTAAFTEYLAAFKMQKQKAALSPSTDRSTSTPSPLSGMSLGLPKGIQSASGKEYNPTNIQQPVTGSKKASGTKATASSTITSMNTDPHQQLATITLTPMSTLTGIPAVTGTKDSRVSSPFGGSAQRVSSPSPILTITPSEGPIPARNKDPPSGRKMKGRKAGNTGQQTRPTPYSRLPNTTHPPIPQLGVPGLSIEPVMGPLMQPMGGGKSSGSAANTGRVDKSLPAGMFDAGVPKDLLASYMELLQKYPHMARSLLLSMKGAGTSSSPVAGTSQQTGGRKQSAKQSNKASTMATMQSAMANMPPTGSVAVANRFSSSPTSIPRISATITPVSSGGYPTDNYNRQSTIVGASGTNSSSTMSLHSMGVSGSIHQQAKTLQQKLAERQKANKARETEGAGGSSQGTSSTKPKPADDPVDVIVLE
uniref:C2 domain-containing protein n=1 Tax=Anopheles minimus TaxID=112268 RepID=A0A182VXI8_9DIPT